MKDLILKAGPPAYQGFTIGRWDGKVVLIKGAIPGETVKARIEEEKKDHCTATAFEIIETSVNRTIPECKFFGICGGCQLQYISYPEQVRIKEEVLQDCLKRISRIETALSPSIFHSSPWNYRLRGQFKISGSAAGFYRERTRDIIDINSCPLMSDEINSSFAIAKDLLKNLSADAGGIDISYGNSAIALIKGVECNVDLAMDFLNSGFKGMFIIADDKKILKFGSHYTTFQLGNLQYTISPMSFFQGHWALNLKVVDFIRESLQPLKGKRILDLYSGAGNFSLPLAANAGEIIAVEENPHAIEDGKRNLEINGIDNYRFIRSSAENAQITGKIDILILDPPRLGLTNRVIEKTLALSPEKIVYISCNPTTLARDLKKLHTSYGIESIRMIDFFPQTYHIESLVFLRQR